MLDGLRLIYTRWSLLRAKERIRRQYTDEIEGARRQKKNQNELEKITQNEQMDLYELDDELSDVLTEYYYRKATRSYLPVPNAEGMWEESRITGRRHLTSVAIRELRAALRQERKDRSESARLWLAGVTGLIGALTGLTALLFKH